MIACAHPFLKYTFWNKIARERERAGNDRKIKARILDRASIQTMRTRIILLAVREIAQGRNPN